MTWKGFPSTVTSAVSIPDRRVAEGYSYYVFSRCKNTHPRTFLTPAPHRGPRDRPGSPDPLVEVVPCSD